MTTKTRKSSARFLAIIATKAIALTFLLVLTIGSPRNLQAQEENNQNENQQETQEQDTTPAPPFNGKITGSDVRLRGGPGRQFKHFGTVKKDTEIQVKEEKREWFRISPPDGAGVWIYGKYVEKTGENSGKVTGTNVNLRPLPVADKTNAPISQISKPATVTILDQTETEGYEHPWYQIEAPDNLPVWVHSDYVTFVSKAKETPKKKTQPPEQDTEKPEESETPDKPSETGETPDQQKQETPEISEKHKQYIKELRTIMKSIQEEEEKQYLDQDYSSSIRQLREFEKRCEIPALSERARGERERLEKLQNVITDSKEKLNRRLQQINRERKKYIKSTLEQIIQTDSYYFDATGFLKSYGKVLGRPAEYQLKKGEERLYFLRSPSKEIKLENYRGEYVGIVGTVEEPPPGWDTKILVVKSITVIK